MEQWTGLIGKDLKVIFEDGKEHFSSKTGTLIDANEEFILLKNGLNTDGIRIKRIVRFEVIK